MITLREWPEPAPRARRAAAARPRLRALRLRPAEDLARPPPPPRCSGTRWWATWSRWARGAAVLGPAIALVVAHHVPCFACHYCRRGSPSMCRALQAHQPRPGRLRGAACACPRPTCEHAAFRAARGDGGRDRVVHRAARVAACARSSGPAWRPGDTVLVVGLGSIGCLLVQLLTLAGARGPGRRRAAGAAGTRPSLGAAGGPTSRPPSTRARGPGQRRAAASIAS